jgi:branched-chain amino acid transport system substrate-binding protein
LLLAQGCRNAAGPAAGGESRNTEDGGEVVVAAFGELGQANRLAWQGLELAATEINLAGGITGRQLRLVRCDAGDDLRQGIRQAQQLADDPHTAMAILSSRQEVAVPAATVLAYHGILTMLTKVSAPMSDISLPLLFRLCPTDAEALNFLAAFCVHKGIKRVAVFAFNEDAARIYANTFETEAGAKGIEIAARLSCDMLTSENTFSRELANLKKSSQFDAIFYSGPPALSVKLINAAAALGIEHPFLGGAREDVADLASLADPLKTTVYIVSPFAYTTGDVAVKRFIDAYRQAYNEFPDVQAAINYNALHLYAQAARAVGGAIPGKVADILAQKNKWDGPFGEIRFNGARELVATKLYMKQFTNGRFETLDFDLKNASP